MPLLLFSAGLCLLVLLYVEKKSSLTGKLIAKPLLSFLFILAAGLQPWADPHYAVWIMVGLALCWIGDVCLIFESDKLFLIGLVSFLLGHVFYAVAFYLNADWSSWSGIALAAALVASGFIFAWLRPHLGPMTVPVMVYILVISAMVGGAWAVAADPRFAVAGRMLVPAGAISFYLSDILVARDRFVAPGFINRAYGLPLYYLAQFMLAFSVAAV